MTTTTATKLICPECRHENEPERIYCHECGTRLDRSAVRVKKEPIVDTQRRVKKMFDPTRARLRALFFTVIKVMLGAGAVAALVQMALPPDLPTSSKAELIASQMRFDLEGMSMKRQPPQLQYTEEQANGYLAYTLRLKQTALNKPLLEFKRAVVAFNESRCRVTAERVVFGYSLYTTCIYSPTLDHGRLVAPITGASIGRLSIHPKLAQFMNIVFADVWSALERELKMLSKIGAIEFHDKNVVLKAAT
jgi:hypothetical protein